MLQQISQQLQAGKAKIVKELVRQAIEQGYTPRIFWKTACSTAWASSVKSLRRMKCLFPKYWSLPAL